MDAPLPPRVLIADNDPDVRDLLGEVLRMRGAHAEVVDNGAQALARLRAGDIDLLVCDLDMPVLDGEGLLRELESWPGAPPVLVVSGYVDAAIQARLRQSSHLRGVLRKPFDVLKFADDALGIARRRAPIAPSPVVGGATSH